MKIWNWHIFSVNSTANDVIIYLITVGGSCVSARLLLARFAVVDKTQRAGFRRRRISRNDVLVFVQADRTPPWWDARAAFCSGHTRFADTTRRPPGRCLSGPRTSQTPDPRRTPTARNCSDSGTISFSSWISKPRVTADRTCLNLRFVRVRTRIEWSDQACCWKLTSANPSAVCGQVLLSTSIQRKCTLASRQYDLGLNKDFVSLG